MTVTQGSRGRQSTAATTTTTTALAPAPARPRRRRMSSQLDCLLTQMGTGKWSILHFLALSYVSLFTGPITMGGAFLAPRLDYSCRVPSSSSSTTTSSISPVSSSSVASSVASFTSECQYTIDTPDGAKIEDCVEFDFDNSTFSTTFTSEFQLACGRQYLQTSFQSMYMFGIFVGAPVNGFMADKFGRKPLVVSGVVCYVALALGSAWLPFLSTVLAARFILGCLHAVCNFSSYVLMIEVMEPKLRTACGFVFYNAWALSLVLYGGLGYLIRDWRVLQTVVTLPGLLLLPALWFLDESPRWLIVSGRSEDAIRVIRRAARWHGADLPPEDELRHLTEGEPQEAQKEAEERSLLNVVKGVIGEALVLLRTPRLRTITLCLYLNYLVAAMVYFGLSLSGTSLSDSPFVYMVLSGLMEVPAYTLCGPIVQRFGRKRTLAVLFLTSAIVLLALPTIPSAYSSTVVTLAMIGKVAITGCLQTVIFYSSELLPTEVRSRGIGTSFMMSRIGGMVSPFITDLVGTFHPWAPFVVFGVGALMAGAVTLLLPETRGKTLPETVAQLEARAKEAPVKQTKVPRIFSCLA
ncbi:organic cation transporter protein-like isoform X1 [Eriocheir sinensis]|uniref:organic cation transporter protein-like isoform X1 n=2 Tax=Eriocheir sinensis TaxID=95602 RepID=UPI0021C58FB7|nr:organic cation transporter protein-like isoform X1 [Eriocheir sinensis]